MAQTIAECNRVFWRFSRRGLAAAAAAREVHASGAPNPASKAWLRLRPAPSLG